MPLATNITILKDHESDILFITFPYIVSTMKFKFMVLPLSFEYFHIYIFNLCYDNLLIVYFCLLSPF